MKTSKDEQLVINGEVKEEAFIEKEVAEAKEQGSSYTSSFNLEDLFGEASIPEKNYLILGDNRPYATDSRYYGLIERQEIIERLMVRLFPLMIGSRQLGVKLYF